MSFEVSAPFGVIRNEPTSNAPPHRVRRGGRPPTVNKLIDGHRNVVERCFYPTKRASDPLRGHLIPQQAQRVRGDVPLAALISFAASIPPRIPLHCKTF
jgi:hypothetical protein